MSRFSISKPSAKRDAPPPQEDIDIVKLPHTALDEACAVSWDDLVRQAQLHGTTLTLGRVIFWAPSPLPPKGESWLRNINGSPSLYRKGPA